jgi:uroporphyrinogen decarboxylase
MKPRERVELALNHREPDRIPIDLGGSICSSIHKQAYVELKEFLGMDLEMIKLVDYVQQLPYLDEALLERFEVDFRMVQLPAATAPGLSVFEDGDYYAFIDRWGSKLHMPRQGGLYFDWVDFPIQEPIMEALEDYDWPRPDPPELNAQLREQAKHLYENTDYALVGSAVIGGGIFEQPARTMGLENFP